MTTPVLTVITVHLNEHAGLKRTAESVAAQQHADFEWLLVDGASAPAWDECWDAELRRPDVVISEKDHGIYDAMNKGLTAAAGEYVLFLNAGDCFAAPSATRSLARHLRSDGADAIVYGGFLFEGSRGAVLRPPKDPEWIRYGLPSVHQAFAYPSQALRGAGGYRTDFKVCGDYDATARMVRSGCTLSPMREVLVAFQYGGHSAQRPLLLAQEAARVQREVFEVGSARLIADLVKRLGRTYGLRLLLQAAWLRAAFNRSIRMRMP
jgi:putative colanic acid biosynthesis glycosyltransferase